MPLTNQVGPADLPSGKKIYFQEPTNQDRRQLAEGLYGEELLKSPGKMDEALAYTCLCKVDDRDLNVEGISWSKRSDLLSLKDGQYYQLLFSELFGVGKEDVEGVRAQAKKLRGGSVS